MKIAVIEDDLTLRQLLKDFLERDYEVVTFEHGLAFIEKLPTWSPDCIISDINMPFLDGIRLRQLLAQKKEMNLIPFIFLTSDHSARLEDTAIRLGIDDFLHKPVNKEALLSSIKRVLIRHQQTQAKIKELDESITQTLLPNLPERVGKLNMVLRTFQPCAGGGDFVLHFPGDVSTIVLGDVMGHGKQAKFFAHVYAGYIQGLLHALGEKPFTPALLLQRLSDHIVCDDYLSSIILTCTVIQETENWGLKIANASHVPLILFNDEKLTRIENGGHLLGLTQGQQYSEELIFLEDNKRLLIATDGVWEIGENSKSHEKICFQDLQRLAEYSLDTLANNLEEKLAKLALKDDWTFLFIESH